MGKRKDMTYWNVPVPKPLDSALQKAIERDWHPTKADFIRDAVRAKLAVAVPCALIRVSCENDRKCLDWPDKCGSCAGNKMEHLFKEREGHE